MKPKEFFIHVTYPAEGIRQWAYSEHPQGVGSRDIVIPVVEYSAYAKAIAALKSARPIVEGVNSIVIGQKLAEELINNVLKELGEL